MFMVYAIHDIDTDHLEAVKAEMGNLGAPTIKVVDCGDYYMALEGSHRLAAAHALGLSPDLEILEDDEAIDITGFDWYQKADWAEVVYLAGEVAGELRSAGNVPYAFGE